MQSESLIFQSSQWVWCCSAFALVLLTTVSLTSDHRLKKSWQNHWLWLVKEGAWSLEPTLEVVTISNTSAISSLILFVMSFSSSAEVSFYGCELTREISLKLRNSWRKYCIFPLSQKLQSSSVSGLSLLFSAWHRNCVFKFIVRIMHLFFPNTFIFHSFSVFLSFSICVNIVYSKQT